MCILARVLPVPPKETADELAQARARTYIYKRISSHPAVHASSDVAIAMAIALALVKRAHRT